MLHPFIQSKLPELIEIFEKHQIKRAYLFGSVVTDKFNNDSDVDFLVEPDEIADPVVAGGILWDLYYALKFLLKREIDLVTRDSLRNKYFIEELNRTCVSIYG